MAECRYYRGRRPQIVTIGEQSVEVSRHSMYNKRKRKYGSGQWRRGRMPKPGVCLHTNGKTFGRGGNEETAKQFSSLRAA